MTFDRYGSSNMEEKPGMESEMKTSLRIQTRPISFCLDVSEKVRCIVTVLHTISYRIHKITN